MMNKQTQKTISKWADSLEEIVEIQLVINNQKVSDILRDFCNKFSDTTSKINITTKKDGNIKEPYIKVNDNLIFKAVPEEKMLETFLDTLTFDKNKISEKVNENLINFNLPVTIKIYISSFCPYCPKVVSDVSQLAFTEKNIRLEVIDAGLFTEIANIDKVVSAPTVIYNENFRWTGTVKPEDIAEVIGNTKPENLSIVALITLLETGKASLISDLMIDSGLIFPAFYKLVTYEKWPIRLGAMVVMEELLDKAPTLAEVVISELWKNFTTYDDPVKGDILYITGETGNQIFLERVNQILDGNYPDEIKEAAEEAMENLQT